MSDSPRDLHAEIPRPPEYVPHSVCAALNRLAEACMQHNIALDVVRISPMGAATHAVMSRAIIAVPLHTVAGTTVVERVL